MNTLPTIGYLVPEFPGQTHAFFWREIQAMEEAGAKLVVFSTRRPSSEACPHEFRDAAQERTHYLFPPRWGLAFFSLFGKPRRLYRMLSYLANLEESTPSQRIKLAALLPIAAYLVAQAKHQTVDHLHVHSCANAAHLAALAHIFGDLSYSLTLHGDLDVYGRDHSSKVRKANFVSAVTRPLQVQLQKVRPDLRTPVIWMGVDCCAYSHPEITSVPNKPSGPVLFLSVARLNRTKGHKYFLQALRQLIDAGHDVYYIIVGDGPHHSTIAAEIDKLDLRDRVQMTGALSELDVREKLRLADVFVLSSFGLGEAAPVAVMEAMASGLPVICSQIGGTPDMIEDGVSGLLTPQRDVPALTEAAQRLCVDPALRQKMGAAAKQVAQTQFDHRQSARRLIAEIIADPDSV